MRQIAKSDFKIDSSKMFIRNDDIVKCVPIDCDIKKDFGDQFQELFKVHKRRNKYFIKGVLPNDPTQDIDDFYLEAGEPTLPPLEMKERMYSVVRFLKRDENAAAEDYLLKKNDIVKMGRVKVKIKHIHSQNWVKVKDRKLKRRQKRIENQNPGEPSKYPVGYLLDAMESVQSNYNPIVGEVNYVQAVLPQPVAPPPLPIPRQEEEKQPSAPPSLPSSSLPSKDRIIEESKRPSSVIDQIRGRAQVHELAPKNQRDHTENAREEEKKQDIVQPSSLLQQI